jgi:hypothetical protein
LFPGYGEVMPMTIADPAAVRPIDAAAATRAMDAGSRLDVQASGRHVSGADVLYRSSSCAPPP